MATKSLKSVQQRISDHQARAGVLQKREKAKKLRAEANALSKSISKRR